jgi:outer membrane protein OmpA-like peptidoglycan-associated protein
LASGYYVVVAAYRLGQDTYAKNYINRISKDGIEAKYGADTKRKYLYVYLDYFEDFDESITEMLATRKKAGFEQAWVRIMKDGQLDTKVNTIANNEPSNKPPQVTEVTKEKEVVASNGVEEVSEPVQAESEVNEEIKPEENVVEEVEEIASEITSEEDVVKEEEPITPPKPISEASVYLSLFNATNNRQIEGDVEVIDIDRARLVEKVKGNEYTSLPDPKSKTGKVSLIANVFGYRPVLHTIIYGQVPNDSTSHFMEWAGNHYVIKFDLVRYHKGDINTLYNVFFYNDAAIMLPESKYQLNSLLTMMKENPNYRIMLHGHTNGNSRGRLITMGPSKSFFSLANDVKDGTGSAKELSRQRAEVIKEWLVSQGVVGDRIEIKAWGGGRMIHDKNSVNAKKNVRVDVEILEE